MAFTYDFDTAPLISYVRLLISDTNAADPIFQDNEITAAYTIQQSQFQSGQYYSPPAGQILPSSPVSYLRVAALLLDAIAANKARLSSIRRILDVELSPSDAAKMLMAQAAAYRATDDDAGAFMVIEQVNDDPSLLSRISKQAQRQQGLTF
jgi:hypothetical protein